ncbi:hypothetical protein Trydic_g9507 [Trypoxylus dichotomus]
MTKIEEADIDAVFNFHHPTILAGDLNSKHPQWNSKTLNRKGKQLKKNSDERNLIGDAPTKDTHIHALTGLTNVLVILKNVTTPYYLETINDLPSDHLPVIMTVSIESSNIQQTIRTTNWQKLEKNLKLRPTSISTDNDIDTVYYFEGTFHPNPPVDRDHEKFTDVFNKQVHAEYRDAIDVQETMTEELRNIIKTLADRKALGHDGITNTAINHLTLEDVRYAQTYYKRYN